MASSYGSVSRQASQGKKSNAILDNWVQKGLDLTKLKIVDDVDNQTISWDEHGFLCKEYVPFTNSYDDRQLKIINNGLYITDNNWLSIKTAIGRFYYINPSSGEITEAYGVNGETIVGKLLLGEQLGIYNSAGSLTFDTDGLTVSNDKNIVSINPNDSSIIKVIKRSTDENDNETQTTIISLNTDGDVDITGNISASTLNCGNKLVWNGTALSVSGTITATTGYIGGSSKTGGWEITSGKIETQYTISNTTKYMGIGVNGTAWAFYANAATAGGSDGIFRVGHNGVLYATGANISGDITATNGFIVKNSSGTTLANFGSTVIIGQTSSGQNNVYINGAHVYMRYGTTNLLDLTTTGMTLCDSSGTTLASFGSTITLGSTNKMVIDSTGWKVSYGTEVVASSVGTVMTINSLTLTNAIYQSSGLTITTNYPSGREDFEFTSYGNFRKSDDDSGSLGTSSIHWTKVYAKNGTIDTSDRKQKDNIEDINFAYDLIMSLRPVTYMWKTGDHRRKHMGFIAQEVSSVCKGINENLAFVTASYKPDKNEDEPKKDYFGEEVNDELLNWGLIKNELIAPMIKVIQTQEERIRELERKIG